MATLENTHPNNLEQQITPTKQPVRKPNKRVSISPKKPVVHSPRIRSTNSRFVQNDENGDDDDDSLASDDNENAKIKKPKAKKRRRRSSARFLRLSQGGAGEDDSGGQQPPEEEELASSEHLGEIYRQAIRMNAENKINAGNSWGLRLIENMDKFIEEVSICIRRCLCDMQCS